MAGKSQVLPTDAWVRSSVMERKLEELVHDGLLRSRASRSQPEWRVPPSDHQEPAPPERYVVSFVAFHERGLGMPPSRFMRALLHHYKVELHHLAPNSISQATIFAAVCDGYLGMEPHWNLWLHLFKAEHFAKKAGERGVRVRFMPVAVPFKSVWVGASSTSWSSSSRRTAGGTTGGSTCAMTMTACRSSPGGS
jgi:hypothetical protein